MKSILKVGSIILLAAAISSSPLSLMAQGTNVPSAEKKSAESGEKKKAHSLPFSGQIAAVDKIGKTITVGKRTFQITSTTRIAKADKTPTVFEEAKVGEHITGSYLKGENGKLVARSIFLGAKLETKAAESTDAEKKKAE